MCYNYRSNDIHTSIIAIDNRQEKGFLNVTESFRTFRPDYPGRIIWKIRPSRISRSKCNTQHWAQIIGKIRAGLSVCPKSLLLRQAQHAVIRPDYWNNPGRIIRPGSSRSLNKLTTRSSPAGLLEKSGPDYPAQLISKMDKACTHADVRPDYWNNPGRIIRPGWSQGLVKNARSQKLPRSIGILRAGLSGA